MAGSALGGWLAKSEFELLTFIEGILSNQNPNPKDKDGNVTESLPVNSGHYPTYARDIVCIKQEPHDDKGKWFMWDAG